MGPGQTLTPPPPRTAAEISAEVTLGRKARSLLAPDLRPGQYLALLIRHRLHADAIRYMAHSLLNREAVWWASLCVRHALDDQAPAAHRAALGAAVRWVIQPDDVHRRAAGDAATAAGKRVPAGSVARAALYAAGPPPPAGAVPSSPPTSPGPGAAPGPMPALILPSLSAKLCASGILLAVTRGPAADLSLRLRQSIALGLDVAYGTNRWE